MRAERLLRLQLLLRARGRLTAAEIGDELGVSVRTVYRDLDTLSASGVPVYAELGPGGGFRLLDTYRSPLGELTPSDAEALLVVGVPGVLADAGLAGPVERAQLKLASKARQSGALFHLDAPRWFHDKTPPPHLRALAEAARDTRAVQVEASGRSLRLQPLGLVNKAGNWYVVALSGEGSTVRRVDRLDAVELLDERFSRPRAFDLARYWDEWSATFERELPQVQVSVRCTRRLSAELTAILGDAVKPRLAAAEQDGDTLLFDLAFDSPRSAASRLAGLAPGLVVLGPEAVLDELRSLAQAVLDTYGEPLAGRMEEEVPLEGGSHSEAVRVGRTVRRMRRPWSVPVQDLLLHLEREGFDGAPRALGFDDQGREVLTYVEGEVGSLAYPHDRFDHRRPDFVWHDEALRHVGRLLREFHDAAVSFPWPGREWCYPAREPVETLCHNEAFPQNTVFRSGVPVAFIDWDTVSPGPRSWDLGSVAWWWVPFWRDAKCRAHGLPTGTADKARRFRLLLDAYGAEPDIAIVRAGIERVEGFLGQMQQAADVGSAHEVGNERRGVFDELALEIAWVEEHAEGLLAW